MYILANGYCVYNGSVSKMVPFLENLNLSCPTNYNPTEHSKPNLILTCPLLCIFFFFTVIELVNMHTEVIKTLSTASNNGISDANCRTVEVKRTNTYRQSTIENLFSKKTEDDFPNPYHVQVAILLKRMFLQMSRNKLMLAVQLLHHLISSVSMGLSFYGVGNNASHMVANFKFYIGVLLFFCYTYVMSPILLCKCKINSIDNNACHKVVLLDCYIYFSSIRDRVDQERVFQQMVQFEGVLYGPNLL